MGKWSLIENEKEFSELVGSLQSIKNVRTVSNYQPLTSDIDEELAYTEFFCSNNDSSVFLIKRCDDFYRLYYACIDGAGAIKLSLPSSVNNSVLITDVVEREDHERHSEVLNELYAEGFKRYKVYHLWECTGCCGLKNTNTTLRIFISEDKSWVSDIYNYFDRYSDCLPMQRTFDRFCSGAECAYCFIDGKYCGGIVYHVNGRIINEDYIFVTTEYRGVGKQMQLLFLERCFERHGAKKVYAWIDDKNMASLKIHEKNGFVKTNKYKMTLARNIRLDRQKG